MKHRKLADNTYTQLLLALQTRTQADNGFVTSVVRAVNSLASDVQSEALLNACHGIAINTPKGIFVGIKSINEPVYGHRYAPVYVPITAK